MGTIGLVLFGVDVWVRGVDPAVGLVLVPTAVLMYDPLIGPEFRTEDGWRFPARSIAADLIALGSTVYAVWDLRGDSTGWGGLLRYLTVHGHLEFPVALFGYKVSLDRVPPYVWFMDRIVDGEHVVVYFPAKRQDRAAILRDLRGAGLRDAWVTPQLPFLVPVAIAYVLSF